MDMPEEDGSTKRDSLMQIIRSEPEGSEMYNSALMRLEDIPEIPFYLEHIWEWFLELNKKRTSGLSGPDPLSWESILYWKTLLEVQIRPIEIEIINIIDSVYLDYILQKRKKQSGGK